MNRVGASPLFQLFGGLAEVLKNRPVDDFKRSIGSHHREGSGNAVDDLAKCEFVLHRVPLRSAFVDAENDQSTPTCPERIRRRPPEHPLGKSWAHAEGASCRLRFLSTVKRSPIRKRGGSDNLAEMLAHHCRRSESCFCGEPFHGQLRCFEQPLRTADARACDPVGGSRTNLCAEVTAQRSRAHGGPLGDDR